MSYDLASILSRKLVRRGYQSNGPTSLKRRSIRETLLAVGLLATLVPSTMAQARTVTDNDARAVALAFIRAFEFHDVDAARRISGMPFLAEDKRLLVSKEDFDTYFREALAVARPDALPDRVLAVRDFEGTRSLASPSKLGLHDKVMRIGDILVVVARGGDRGVVLIGERAGKIVVVGFGSCEGDRFC
jgi:hypothetical protein